jgi:hypothetical protein
LNILELEKVRKHAPNYVERKVKQVSGIFRNNYPLFLFAENSQQAAECLFSVCADSKLKKNVIKQVKSYIAVSGICLPEVFSC